MRVQDWRRQHDAWAATNRVTGRRTVTGWHRVRLATVGVAVGVCVAACGSSGGSGATSGSATQTGDTSASTSAVATTTTTGGGAGTASASSEVAAAEAVVKKYRKAPTTIPPTTPLIKKPPSGKTFVWLQCDLSQCTTIGSGIAAAAKSLGWTVKVLDFQDADPSSLTSAMTTALQYHPVGVALSGIDPAQWASELPAYRTAHVPIAVDAVGPTLKIAPPVVADVGDSRSYALPGVIIANDAIADSDAKAHVLVVDVPTYLVLKESADSMVQTLHKGCTACTYTTLNISLPELGNNGLIPAVVSALRKNPSVDYVLSVNGTFTDGLRSALNAAGLTKVKIMTTDGGINNQQSILQGEETATMGWPGQIQGWMMVDSVARASVGMTVPPGDGFPTTQLLDSTNLKKATPTLEEPPNYPSLFEKLWHVG